MTLNNEESRTNLKRWQPEGVTTVLDPEYAHQEAVHAENDGGPDNDCKLLGTSILDPWNPQSEIDGGECEYGV